MAERAGGGKEEGGSELEEKQAGRVKSTMENLLSSEKKNSSSWVRGEVGGLGNRTMTHDNVDICGRLDFRLLLGRWHEVSSPCSVSSVKCEPSIPLSGG